MRPDRKGYTLVEIMIVVAIIALLSVISLPSFQHCRRDVRRDMCINNLRLIDHAKNQWATTHNKKTGETVDEADILPYVHTEKRLVCPCGGTYTFGPIGASPTCSYGGDHVLPL